MNAKELHDALSANPTSGTEIAVLAAANMSTILRALSLLAAAESSDGTTPETTACAEGDFDFYPLAARLESERNGLAAEVLRLRSLLPNDYTRADMEARES